MGSKESKIQINLDLGPTPQIINDIMNKISGGRSFKLISKYGGCGRSIGESVKSRTNWNL